MSASASASAIVRVKDKAATIERTLETLRRQTVPVEVIVVDSGSRDGSLPLARRHADRLIEIPSGRFSYGYALNLGAEAASGDVCFALSAHCVAGSPTWVEQSLAHYARPEVAGTNGAVIDTAGRPLTAPVDQTLSTARRHPRWGFSNHGSSWRRAVWREHPFDERLESAEDKEWALRVLAAGWTLVFDPALWIDSSHQWRCSARDVFRRERLAARALASFTDIPPYASRELLAEWWSELPDRRRPAAWHRLNYRRSARLLGRWLGSRERTRPVGISGPAPSRTARIRGRPGC